MAYLGKIKLSEFCPNHPFAHNQISFVPCARAEESLPVGKHGVEVSVSWGYETHSVKVGIAKWKQIRAGEAIMVKSIGWYEGKSFPCHWYFDLGAEDSLVVCYGDDGGQGFVGHVRSARIEQIPAKGKNHVQP
jgi:hypothetical protein